MIHPTAILQTNLQIGKNIAIGAYVIIGDSPEDVISIGDDTVVGHHSYIFGDVSIGSGCTLDPYTRIGDEATIGNKTKLLYGARVHYDVIIGNACSIAGNCPDRTRIGDFVIHLGKISHSYYHPFEEWDVPEEPGPTIGSKVVIGTDANIIGPVTIGDNVFIFPREIVRKNIPADSIYQNNTIKHMPNWQKYLRSLGASNWTIQS